ncbi:hypothetical protein [Thiocystis violascens]|uniref:hypothetical protein n=1 Tax=Thiocystis violascens TaxID=73141 RepID=UPI00145C8C02|nr:hypothetical protein [Thiocystis violascens]
MSDLKRQPHAFTDLSSRHKKARKIEQLLYLASRRQPLTLLEVGTGCGGIAHYFATHPEFHRVRIAYRSAKASKTAAFREEARRLKQAIRLSKQRPCRLRGRKVRDAYPAVGANEFAPTRMPRNTRVERIDPSLGALAGRRSSHANTIDDTP